MPQLKKCHGCGDRYAKNPNDDSFVCWCSPDCGLIVARARQAKARDKARRTRQAAVRRAHKENKTALRDLNRRDIKWQKPRTSIVFNRMRVLQELEWFADRGLQPTCISCDRPNMDWSCGHYQTVGSNGRLRYSEINTYLQCNKYCNSAQSGNISGNKASRGYEVGLVERFGSARAGWIMEWCHRINAPKKWECDELEVMRSGFAAEARRIEKKLALLD